MRNSAVISTLGDSDAWPRWWGVVRHRLVLTLGTVILGADWLVRPASLWCEPVLAIVGALAALPVPSATSAGSWGLIQLRFLARRRGRWISLEPGEDTLRVDVRGAQRVWCYEFIHRGRLDLSGRDIELATRLSHLAQALAQNAQNAHLCVHVDTSEARDSGARVSLSVNRASHVPSEWRPRSDAAVPSSATTGRMPFLERRGYVRTSRGVVQTLRVKSFTPGRASDVLVALGATGTSREISLHANILSLAKARRVSARAVHRVGADAQFSRGAGFRWSASDQKGLDALRVREEAVAQGAALCQWALYVVVRATNVSELRRRVSETLEVARARGVVLDRGIGVQGDWYIFQLPGGQGW